MIATGPYLGISAGGLAVWVEKLMTQPHVVAAFPPEQRSPEWRRLLVHKIRVGLVAAYVPEESGRPMGLYWADLCGAGTAFGHQVLAAEAKGMLAAVTAMRVCITALFRDYPDIHHLYGLTPTRLPGAVAAARRAGMALIGESYDSREACWFLAAGRTEWEAKHGQ